MDYMTEQQPGRRVKPRKARNFIIILGVLLVALAVLNPTKEEFSEYAADNLQEKLADWLSGGVTEALATSLLNSIAERDNYIFFSVFSLPDIQGSSTFLGEIPENKKYLGLFKRFFFEL